MNDSKVPVSLSRERGITLVEILLVIALLVVVLSFAIPTMGNASAKAEMQVAVENVTYSVKMARNTARLREDRVELAFRTLAGEPSQTLSFNRPDSGRGTDIADYRLPDSVELVADQASFLFDERGLVENPGTITLVSRNDETVTETIEVR
jgi:type II secretory pathway pseudopilin PulG